MKRALLTTAEVQELTGFDRETIYRKARRNQFPGVVRIPGSQALRFQRSAIEELIGQSSTTADEAAA